MEEIEKRNDYLQKLWTLKDKQIIKVLTGIRRCGKSTLLEQFRAELLAKGIEEQQIIFINFEDFKFKKLQNPEEFYNYVSNLLLPDKKMYLFFDEIQRVENFQEVVDSFFINKDNDIYITGSNSKILSGELATFLSGRYIEIKMQPFSFAEFKNATDKLLSKKQTLEDCYRNYLEKGSFPYVLQLFESDENINNYLESIFDTILLKDVISRNKISDVNFLQSVTEFVFDNIGLELSSKKIADTMTSSGRKIDSRMVENYLTALSETYMVYKVKRYNIKGKEILKSLEKYYACDMALRSTLLGKKAMDVGHILENVVFLELLRRKYKVYTGKVDDTEVDFVCMNENGPLYIQVAASVRDEKTLERELRPLKQIKDSYPKLILTLDNDPDSLYDGILRTNALEWLLG